MLKGIDKNHRQVIAAALLVVAAYKTLRCPCVRIMSCHKMLYFLTVGGATLIVVNDNT